MLKIAIDLFFTHKIKKKNHTRNIKLDFISVFVFTITALQAVQGQSHWKKKLRVLHLSLVGVYKINIIPPLGEKVRFIPRQAVVWQTKFVSIKISYWEFSIYI